MADLFSEEPAQWGLRGDPGAWEAMRLDLSGVAVPDDGDAAESILKASFAAVTGADLDDPAAPEAVYCKQFYRGGMSAGAVDLGWWRERLIPLLLSRIDQ